jgi:hypothetical protein
LDKEGPILSLHKVSHWVEVQGKDPEPFDDNPLSMLSRVGCLCRDVSAFTLASDCRSVLVMPRKNLYLCPATIGSVVAHAILIEVPDFQKIFHVVDFSREHWAVVCLLEVSTLIIEEIFKVYVRTYI